MKLRPFVFGAAIVAVALVPAVFSVSRALADGGDDDEAEPEAKPQKGKPALAHGPELSGPELEKKRRKILGAITTDENVLINVSGREMPASPDIMNLGRKGTKALARCVADNVDDGLRAMCANMLGRLGDAAALPALHGALEAWDASVRRAAIDALRAIPSPTSADPLIKLLGREDEEPENIAAAYRALGATSTGKAVKVLRAALRDSEKEAAHRDAAFDGLWKSRHLVPRDAMVSDVSYALGSNVVSLQAKATKVAAELRAPALVSGLASLMGNADVHVRNRAVYALGKIGDKAAASALLAQIPKVREARMLNNIAFALERLDPSAFYGTAQKLADHKQASIRMNTAFVLGDVRRAEGVPLLQKALADKNDVVRVSAVNALGKIDSPDTEKLLLPLTSDPNAALRHEAVLALYLASGKRRTDLIFDKLYSAEDPAQKLEAALLLADASDVRVTQDILACVENGRCPLPRVEGFLLRSKTPEVPGRIMLEWTAGRTQLTPLVIALKPAGAAPLATSSISKALAHADTRTLASATDLAGALRDKEAATALARVASHEVAMVRVHGLLAQGALGDVSADAKLLAEIDNLSASRLARVSEVLGTVAAPEVRTRLLPEIVKREKSADLRLAMACAAIHLAWDADTAIFRFLDALASDKALERDLAVAYLRRDDRERVTWLMRRAVARESRPYARDVLRTLVDARARRDS